MVVRFRSAPQPRRSPCPATAVSPPAAQPPRKFPPSPSLPWGRLAICPPSTAGLAPRLPGSLEQRGARAERVGCSPPRAPAVSAAGYGLPSPFPSRTHTGERVTKLPPAQPGPTRPCPPSARGAEAQRAPREGEGYPGAEHIRERGRPPRTHTHTRIHTHTHHAPAGPSPPRPAQRGRLTGRSEESTPCPPLCLTPLRSLPPAPPRAASLP